MLNSPAKGAVIPPKASQGDSPASSWSDWVASSGLTGTTLLPPSM